jgi:hypothetical protein
MSIIKVDITKSVKKMKPMHGGGQPPIGGKDLIEYFHYLTEAGIPYSRLHDVGGPYGSGRFVDIPNLFRNFDADENDPANYDFAFTDHLIKALVEAKVEPYFRLGVTIENQGYIKGYNTDPPKDFHKWARICEHVIMHYTEGWGNGFHYKITYWEIWNEPEGQGPGMWNGTAEDYFRLYDITAKHLKARFPHIKVGGYSCFGLYAFAPKTVIDPVTNAAVTIQVSEKEEQVIEFFYKFFDYIKKHGSPIDFFSWHSYSNVRRVPQMDKKLHEVLVDLGYGEIETHINEWNPVFREYGTGHHSAEVSAMLIALQHGYVDVCCIYDMRTNTAPYCPVFDINTHKPIHAYYSLASFNRLYRLGTQVETDCDTPLLCALAASNGEDHALLISNVTGEEQDLCIKGVDLAKARYYALDNERLLSWSPAISKIPNNTVILIEW